MSDSVLETLSINKISVEDISCFIPHQANVRIIDSIAKRLGVEDRMFSNIEKYANTSSAALAIAIDEASKNKVISKGDYVVLTVFEAVSHGVQMLLNGTKKYE